MSSRRAARPAPAVTKTLVRHAEAPGGLHRPALCSSAALAARREAVRSARPAPAPPDTHTHRQLISEKVTKKLNFPFSDNIYKNLIELNTNHDEMTRKDKKIFPAASQANKRDQEPKLEDFFPEELDSDVPPDIPAVTLQSKPIRSFNNNRLHKLVSSFESL